MFPSFALRSNLWNFAVKGADIVLFSGGMCGNVVLYVVLFSEGMCDNVVETAFLNASVRHAAENRALPWALCAYKHLCRPLSDVCVIISEPTRLVCVLCTGCITGLSTCAVLRICTRQSHSRTTKQRDYDWQEGPYYCCKYTLPACLCQHAHTPKAATYHEPTVV